MVSLPPLVGSEMMCFLLGLTEWLVGLGGIVWNRLALRLRGVERLGSYNDRCQCE